MSALAMISFVAAMVMIAIWLLAFGAKLAGSRTLARPVTAGAGQATRADAMPSKLARDPFAFLFDRGLPAAAAAVGTRRSARESVTSADGALSINLSSPSRREVEISLAGTDQPPGTIAVVHVTDESSDRRVLIPLTASGQPAGVALVPTTSRQVGISRDVKLMRDTDLGIFSAADIGHSVRASAGPTRDRWQELAAMAQSGLVIVPEAVAAAITAAL